MNKSKVNSDSLNDYFKSTFTVDNGNQPKMKYTFPKQIDTFNKTDPRVLNLLL